MSQRIKVTKEIKPNLRPNTGNDGEKPRPKIIPKKLITYPVETNSIPKKNFVYKDIVSRIKSRAEIRDGHWIVDEKRQREGLKISGQQRGMAQWLYFCDKEIDPRTMAIKMKRICGEEKCVALDHHIRCDVKAHLNDKKDLEWDWDTIEKVIMIETSIVSDNEGDHIVWNNPTYKGFYKRQFNHIERPVNQWLYMCKTRQDPTKRMRMVQLCSKADCVTPDHWINTADRDSIYMIGEARLKKNTIRDPSGCLLWKGFINEVGYGHASFNCKCVGAHIFSMLLKMKVMRLPYGTLVRHKCRNRHCVEQTHLEIGDAYDNARDKKRDGTALLGAKNPAAKLTEENVLEIVRDKDQPVSKLANKYMVSEFTIWAILRGKTWSHLTGIIPKKPRAPRIFGWITDRTTTEFFSYHMSRIQNNITVVQDDKFSTPHWIWNGSKDVRGYGCVHMSGRSLKAHQMAWIIHNKKEVPLGLILRHKCKEKACCNPDHLEPGTYKQNMLDKIRDGTMKKVTKLDEETVIEIFKRIFNDKEKSISIAKELGVSTNVVCGIRTGRSWKDLKEKLVKEGIIIISSDLATEADGNLTDECIDVDVSIDLNGDLEDLSEEITDEFVGIFDKNEPDIEYFEENDENELSDDTILNV